MLDRFFDNYVMTPMQKIVFDHLRAEDERDPHGVADARAAARHRLPLARRRDGGARPGPPARRSASPTAPPRPRCSMPTGRIRSAATLPTLRAYRARLLARPSFARAVDEARPYRPLFPPGAPDRD